MVKNIIIRWSVFCILLIAVYFIINAKVHAVAQASLQSAVTVQLPAYTKEELVNNIESRIFSLKKNEKHIFAIESDAGGFAPRGISLDMVPQRRRLIFAFKDLFLPYGVYNFDEEYAGQDIVPLKRLGVPLAELVPDMQRYFDIHHTSEDTFDKVNRRELMLGAVTIAQIVYMIDQKW